MDRGRIRALLLSVGVMAMMPWALPARAPRESVGLRLVKTIPLPGVEGRFDHFALDAATGRLFLAALGNGTVEIIDANTGGRIGSLRGLEEPQGIAYAPGLKRLFVASGGDGTCRIYDGAADRLLEKIDLHEDADNVRFDARGRRVYVGYGAGALAVIDAATGRHEGDIKLAAHPESFQLEKNGARIFVNVPDARSVVVIDRAKGSVIANWPLGDYHANFPMALDEPRHRLFVACRKPAEVRVLDTESGKELARIPAAGDADDLWYDAGRQSLYVSGGEGFVSVIRQLDADHYVPVAKIATAAGARTSFFAPELGRLFLAVPHRGSQSAEVRVYQVTVSEM